MGSQATQARLWGHQPTDWSTIQEPTAKAGYDYAINALNLTGQETLLDIGCGTGVFLSLAAPKVRFITGLDGTVELVEEARRRLPAYPFLVGEMEDLPLPDEAYDVVTAFNSFQYAETVSDALAEARRVLKPGGRLVAMIWGNKEDCQAAISLGAIGSLVPPPPPGTPGLFTLSEEQRLEKALEKAGFTLLQTTDVESIWEYPDVATVLRGLLSTGPAHRAITHVGYEKVAETVTATLPPFTRPDGHIVYNNKFRVVIASRPLAAAHR
ncbi:MAG TPA: class I SAM-dependent methyltransferase [Puia sp.]|nr:class I SAM-dependent methyltransferase [Puia sp.]